MKRPRPANLVAALALAALVGGVITEAAQRPQLPAAGSSPPSWDAVTLWPGDVIQDSVEHHPANTTFFLKAGTYRINGRTIRPKAGQSFIGETSNAGLLVTISGAKVLSDTAWVFQDPYWVIGGQTQQNRVYSYGGRNICEDSLYADCNRPEELFYDDVMLTQVTELDLLTDESRWFLSYAGDSIYTLRCPWGHHIEAAVDSCAISAHGIPTADNVTIRNLIFEKFASPTQVGAVYALGPSYSRWVVEGCEFRWNHSYGLSVGFKAVVRENYFHHNGLSAFSHWGGDSVLIYDNEIAFNNVLEFRRSWEGGGWKSGNSYGPIIRRNHVHDNYGHGIWLDGNVIGAVVDSNTVENNYQAGIYVEVSYYCVVRDNTVRNTGWSWKQGESGVSFSGIQVSGSPGVEVFRNSVTNCGNGIVAFQTDRSGDSGDLGPYLTQNLSVHDNVITADKGRAAGFWYHSTCGFCDSILDPAWNNLFDSNTYHLNASGRSGDSLYFMWDNAGLNEELWQAVGQDPSSTFHWE